MKRLRAGAEALPRTIVGLVREVLRCGVPIGDQCSLTSTTFLREIYVTTGLSGVKWGSELVKCKVWIVSFVRNWDCVEFLLPDKDWVLNYYTSWCNDVRMAGLCCPLPCPSCTAVPPCRGYLTHL